MTSFLDGPAKGKRLMLKRIPRFLRVTESEGKWDALNEEGDTPRPDEKLHAYEFAIHHGNCHVNAGRGRGGFYAIVDYRHITVQPTDAEMRDNGRWGVWCERKAIHTPEARQS